MLEPVNDRRFLLQTSSVRESPSELTGILWEADDERRSGDLLLEQVLLVQEQDDGRIDEPL